MMFTHAQWLALLPILLTSATAIAVMSAIAIRRNHWWNATISVAGLNLALISTFFAAYWGAQMVTPLLVVDNYAVFYMAMILVMTLATATLLHAYMSGYDGNKEEIYLLLVLSSLGAVLLACSSHLASMFIGIELLSIPLYGMIAYPVKLKHALEGGIKYLVLSAVASAFLLFGMALIYSQTGTLSFDGIAVWIHAAGAANGILLIGAALVLVGLSFKISAVPFHLWTPDVYDGAPAPITGYLATASKTAAFAVLLRFFIEGGFYRYGSLLDVLTAIAVASILVGNIAALFQNNVKRMLAYSSIAHMGYVLVAVIAIGPLGTEAVGAYLLTYVVATLSAFGVVTLMSSPFNNERDATLYYDYRGLFWRRPYLTSIMTVAMLSLAGIPLTAGFIGKFYVVAAGVDARLWLLVGTVVVGSSIGLYYYLRLMITLFLLDPQRRRFTAPLNWAQQMGGYMVVALMLLMLLLGIYPQPFINLIHAAGLIAG
ncbi:MAG TPA: NADH-quinone oxidoreductase subunit NuoN [Stenotrophobium sp.]|jgi:NADH-quinone oxidoreductase subunit N|nr:NADH-quinone oxidoreductase subunit NuoN [Stenotrophobium sp.]